MEQPSDLLKRWDFNWGVMDVMIGGKSAIDLDKINVKNWKDATEFLKHYGFDPDHEPDARFIHAVIIESLCFISKKLMPREWSRGNRPPNEILKASDARPILLWASDSNPENKSYQAWACALIRVMHTITHIEGIKRHVDMEAARDQIMGRLNHYVYVGNNSELRFGSQQTNIPLYKIEWKKNKSRESIITKLLHKKGNVAETIYDLLGVRIVTQNLCDVMIVVKLLRDLYMITFPNCNPGRARNTLLDTEHFQQNIDALKSMLEEGKITSKEFLSLIERVITPIDHRKSSTSNPHTATTYRSVQLTCRQLITVESPEQKWRSRVERYLKTADISDASKSLSADILKYSRLFQEVHTFTHHHGYFPFEIQILDKESYLSNQQGDANHNRYKSSQIRAARRRVLGKVLTLKKQK